jgi:DNA-binding CsgD family transcriptional regulator
MGQTHRPAEEPANGKEEEVADGNGCQLFTAREWAALARMQRLSPREMQLLQAVFGDLKDQTIAVQLGISIHTVRTHFERLFRKLQVHSRVGLMIRAFRGMNQLRGSPAAASNMSAAKLPDQTRLSVMALILTTTI